MKITTQAQLNGLQTSPRKVRLVVGLIRGLKVDDALLQLQYSKKHATLPVKKLLDSAIANALHNHNASRESLVVKTAYVNEGKTLHRWMPRAMGRATPLKKRSSHITIELEGDAPDATTTTEEVAVAPEKAEETKE